MKKCPYCKRRVWPWQQHVFSLHNACLDIYCQGYAQGIKIASEQAAKIMTEIQRKFMPQEKRETMQ